MDIIKALGKSAFKSAFSGFAVIALSCWYNFIKEEGNGIFVMFFVLTILNFFLVFCFVVGFLLPLSRIEKKRIEEQTLFELFKRYLPIVIFPVSTAYYLIIKSEISSDTATFFFLIGMAIINQFSLGLWTFLKSLKTISA